ncbi:cell division protein FtsL [Paracoccus caeni]|uniref:Cell division protein FtsL n=1 Tax=Paracoccus caeni TaxID=657651 RepID=A0A934W0T0_9RHOB|nr:cell division protein FtsL [Paracoccus caeni]MBK4216663.1 cell division protein FtsL [Paracoccus caeni]
MRSLTYLACVLVVMALAFWAYRENYSTQAAIDEMRQVQREIAGLREDLGVLRAEWAYLNRPERLRDLVELNFDRLQLMPLAAGQVIDLGNIDYPKPPAPQPDPSESPEE